MGMLADGDVGLLGPPVAVNEVKEGELSENFLSRSTSTNSMSEIVPKNSIMEEVQKIMENNNNNNNNNNKRKEREVENSEEHSKNKKGNKKKKKNFFQRTTFSEKIRSQLGSIEGVVSVDAIKKILKQLNGEATGAQVSQFFIEKYEIPAPLHKTVSYRVKKFFFFFWGGKFFFFPIR